MAICIFECRTCQSGEFERRNVRIDKPAFCRECGEQLYNISVGQDLKTKAKTNAQTTVPLAGRDRL